MKLKYFSYLIIVLVLIAPHQTQAASHDPKLAWSTVKTQHFRIHYPQGLEASAAALVPISEKVYQELQPRFDWKPWGPIEIVLTDHTDGPNGFATVLPYNWMTLYVVPPNADSNLSRYHHWLEEVFRHELTHILHIDTVKGVSKFFRFFFGRIIAPNGLTPGWVREGLATQQESLSGTGRLYHSFTHMLLRSDILNDDFLKLDQMAGSGFDWPRYNAAYLYGAMFWDYLAKSYGQEKIYQFSQKYGSSLWLFSLNHKAKKVFGKSFYKLHQAWKAELSKKYQDQKNQLEKLGLSQVEVLEGIQKKSDKSRISFGDPSLSPDGLWLYYVKGSVHESRQLWRLNTQSGKKEKIKKKFSGHGLQVSPDGKKLLYSQRGTHKRYYSFEDLYELDLASLQAKRLTTGERAYHPAYSPDGKKIVYVKNLPGYTELRIYDKKSKKSETLKQEKAWRQQSHPVFSPDGKSIAFSQWQEGQRDLIIFNLKNKKSQALTKDPALELHPQFSADGRRLYFISDRSGISNLYAYDLKDQSTKTLSNVLTGIFKPQIHSNDVYVQYYNGDGFDLRKWTLPNPKAKKIALPNFSPQASEVPFQNQELPSPQALEEQLAQFNPKKYSPFSRLFVPRYLLPGFAVADSSILLSLSTGSYDPLRRHLWNGGITYRSDANFLGGFFNYTYNRYRPRFFASFVDAVVNYGDLFGIGQNFYEERRLASLGMSISGNKHGRHGFSGAYFFEHRSAQSFVPANPSRNPSLGRFSGLSFRYQYSRTKRHPADISLESGPRLRMNLQITDAALGSSADNEQVIFSGDLRQYFVLPWRHVLALRLAGGITFGDRLSQGTFRLGSALGEGPLTATSSRLFTLRGLPQITFAGEKALLFSGEYRLPLARPQRGLGTLPIYLKQVHLAFFADYGTIFNRDLDFNNFLLGVGAELRGDFVLGYGLPITARLGYGVIVKGREFIGGLSAPFTGADLRNGTFILELGTSF